MALYKGSKIVNLRGINNAITKAAQQSVRPVSAALRDTLQNKLYLRDGHLVGDCLFFSNRPVRFRESGIPLPSQLFPAKMTRHF